MQVKERKLEKILTMWQFLAVQQTVLKAINIRKTINKVVTNHPGTKKEWPLRYHRSNASQRNANRFHKLEIFIVQPGYCLLTSS